MLSFPEKIILVFAILITFFAFFHPVYRKYRIIRSGSREDRFDHIIKRLWDTFNKVLFQRCTLRNERIITGFMHVFIFYGALSFDTMTLNHTMEGFIPNFYLFGHSDFGLFFSLLIDIFAILVTVGVVFFAIRRFILKPKAYATTLLDSGIIYLFLIFATFSYLYFECFAIAHHPGTERFAFVGTALSGIAKSSGLSEMAIGIHFKAAWWLHILIVYAFIAYVPHSKYFHMFTGPFNVFFRSRRSLGELESQDLENSETFGIEKAPDFTWKDFLDTFSCMECGRCQDVCPAFASDKPLSPKMIVFNLKKHLLEQRLALYRKQRDKIPPLIRGVFTEKEIWTCTTCGACLHVCPVEIEHIRKIIGTRQSQVLMEGKFPPELNSFFRNIETNSNPWGIGFADRADWAEGLDVRLMSQHPHAEYLFWVGCAGSFDEEGKKIARAMVSILKKADVDFAILGTEEKCCGDSAKRLGNEYLFQMTAGSNIELFNKYSVKKIIVICPHGYNTFKNEYPALLNLLPQFSVEEKTKIKRLRVIHYVQLIDELLQEGRLPLNKKIEMSVGYHDSCYLGRHNGIVDEPRNILKALCENSLNEFSQNKEHSFCCGAGGGLMWTEETLGKRINHIRVEEVIDSGSDIAVTSCPFCQTMIQDGLKDKEREDIKVKDLAQMVAESLED